MLGERGEADKRVVAPEVSCAARPPGEAGAEQAAMYAQRHSCWAREEKVRAPTMIGSDWISAVRELASMRRTSSSIASGDTKLSASSSSMYS